MKMRALPSTDLIRSLLRYDSSLGKLYWLGKRMGRPSKSGDEAGGIDAAGYRFVIIGGKSYRSHRIIWALETGKEPEDHIDHINGDKTNNRISNLREATASQNSCNSRIRSDSTTGIKGLSYDGSPKRRKRWRAVIMIDQKYIQVGRFANKEDAILALDEARARLHGEFARAA